MCYFPTTTTTTKHHLSYKNQQFLYIVGDNKYLFSILSNTSSSFFSPKPQLLLLDIFGLGPKTLGRYF